MRLIFHLAFSLAGLLAALIAVPARASTESQLNASWRGTWIVIGVEIASDCAGHYTNNEIRERRVSARGDHRFAAGELARVHKINLKRRQAEILVDLTEPLRVSYREGPFTLYDHLDCKVELQIKLPGNIDRRSASQVDGLIGEILERHEGVEAAQSSVRWNRRRREPFPHDYAETLVAYEHWRTRQVNAAVAAKIEDSVEEATRRVDRLADDRDYLDGFAEGVYLARKVRLDQDCDRLVSLSASSFVESGSRDEGREFRDGFREGQELVLFLEMARRLKRCFLPPPA